MENERMDVGERSAGKLTLKRRLMLLLLVIAVPLTCMVLGILIMIGNYSSSYNKIMSNLEVANQYNMSFKQEMEYSMYRVMIGLIDTDKFKNGDIQEGKSRYATTVKNPVNLIESTRYAFTESVERAPGTDSDIKLKGILSCLDSLETAVNKMVANSKLPGTYDENNEIWENDVQGLCSMIQDYITQYTYYEIVNMEALQQELEIHTKQIMLAFIALLLAGLAIGFTLSAMLTRSVTNPINNLRLTAEKLGQGDLAARASLSGLEDINVLARTFNKMSDEIAGLMEKTKTEQKNLWAAELKLRQEQINPHFLYNTLDSIIWMAEGGNNKQVVEMTSDLSDFFRTVLSEGRDFITIAEEETHIRSYLKIQKIRYEDILDYTINMEPEITNRIVLKMILQPIVENALYHGIKNKRGGGTITVRGYEEHSGIVFEVEDDGIGMDEETLIKLRRKLQYPDDTEVNEKGSFGLNNVAQRIRMYYGEGSDITIESEKNVGTCIKVYIGHPKK